MLLFMEKVYNLPSQVDWQCSSTLQQRRAVTSFDVLHQHAQVMPCLKRPVERHHKRIVGHGEYVTFGEHLDKQELVSIKHQSHSVTYLIHLIPED